jgi:hypothetical protein
MGGGAGESERRQRWEETDVKHAKLITKPKKAELDDKLLFGKLRKPKPRL